MRALFYVFLSIIGISLSVIILIPSLFDVNNYKEKIESIVFNKTGNILKINGDINLSFFSGIRLVVRDITYKTQSDKNLFTSKELIIVPQILPMFKKELVFDSIKLFKPVIFIQKEGNKKTSCIFK